MDSSYSWEITCDPVILFNGSPPSSGDVCEVSSDGFIWASGIRST